MALKMVNPKSRSIKTVKKVSPSRQVAKRGAVTETTKSFWMPSGGATRFAAPQPADSAVGNQRVWIYKTSRFNPIKGLTPEILADRLDQFKRGYLRMAALTFQAIAERDDLLSCVIPKRKMAIKQREWEIITADDSPEAKLHKETLETFWRNITVQNALDLNEKGGFPLLVDQMMNAIGMRYSCHELLWRPSMDGLTCQFNYVPLMWFESRIGILRFLPFDLALEGIDLEPGAWMITVGPGLMEPSAVCYMWKKLAIDDWNLYNEKHGMPGIMGRTKAAKDSTQWNNLVEAVGQISTNFSVVVGAEDEIEKMDFSQDGQLPYPPMVERMDRALSAIWRGADLSTMSAGHHMGGSGGGSHGQGASVQGDETDLIESGDAQLISDTLNFYLEKTVIEWTYGEGTKPLAYLKILVPKKQNIDNLIKVWEFLLSAGVKLSVTDASEVFGVPVAQPDDKDLLTPPVQMPVPLAPGFGGKPGMNGNGNGNGAPKQRTGFAANEKALEDRLLLKNAAKDLVLKQQEVLRPIKERIDGILEMTNALAFQASLEKLQSDLPDLLRSTNADPATARVLEEAIGASLLNGIAEATADKPRGLKRRGTRPVKRSRKVTVQTS
jgi:phage gp29-like protein